MKKINKIVNILLIIVMISVIAEPVHAVSSTLVTGIETDADNPKLGYIVGEGYDNTFDEHQSPAPTQTAKHGSINIFGKLNDTEWYETALIRTPRALATGATGNQLSGIFPVFTVDGTTYNYLTNSSGILSGTFDDVKLEVTPEFAYDGNFIKLTFDATTTSTTAKTIKFGAYNDIYLNGNKYFGPEGSNGVIDNLVSGTTNYGIQLPKVGTDRGISFILKKIGDLDVDDVNKYWYGNRLTTTTPITSEYSKVFTGNSTTYDETVGVAIKTANDSAMSFSWEESVSASNPVSKSILIGVGPMVTLSGLDEYDLDDSEDVMLLGDLVDPGIVSPETNQLWYSLNDGTAKKLGTPKSNAYEAYNINLKDEVESCDDYTLKVWVGETDDATKVLSNVAEHAFKTISNACKEEESKKTGIGMNYIILTTILVGGAIAFVYSKKHNKFPQI